VTRAGGPAGRRPAHHVRPLALVSLLAGRGLCRFVQYGSTLLLLSAWGTDEYAVFAGALGSFGWLTALISSGPEKAALKLLPRARRTYPDLYRAFLVIAVLSLPAAAAFGVAAAVGAWSQPTLIYFGTAAVAVSIGCNLLLVGLARVRGWLRRDPVNHVALSGTFGLLAAAAVAGLGPVGYLTGLVAALTVLNADLLRRLGRPSLRIRRRPRLLRQLAGTVALMGGAEVTSTAVTSVLFLELSLTRWSRQAAVLFPLLLVWSAGANLFAYLLRVYQPRTSLRLAGRGVHAGRREALRYAPAALALAAAYLLTAGLAVALTDIDRLPVGLELAVVLAVLLAGRTPSFLLLSLMAYRLENIDGRGLRVNAFASVLALAAVTLTGLWAIPAFGAVGFVCTDGVLDLVQAATVLVLRRRISPPAPRPAAPQPALAARGPLVVSEPAPGYGAAGIAPPP
jgi:hypothetical protein